MITRLEAFDWTDLQSNRAGFLTETQKQDLSDYIDQQGTMFTWHLLAVGTYGVSFAVTMWNMMDNRPVNADSFMVALLGFLLVGGVILPYSARQMRDLYRTLILYRTGRVDSLVGECRIYTLAKQPDHYLLMFGNFEFVRTYDEPPIHFQSGNSYQIYFIGSALLSFEAA